MEGVLYARCKDREAPARRRADQMKCRRPGMCVGEDAGMKCGWAQPERNLGKLYGVVGAEALRLGSGIVYVSICAWCGAERQQSYSRALPRRLDKTTAWRSTAWIDRVLFGSL